MKYVRNGDLVLPVLSIGEAQERIEKIRPLYAAMRTDWKALSRKRAQHDEFVRESRQSASPEIPETIERLEQECARLQERIESRVREVAQHGAVLKSTPEDGLLDFYSEREGRIVCLCWKWGEDSLAWWHETDTGFANRQPL